MGRKTTTTQPQGIIVTDADTPGLPALTEAANVMAVVQANHNEDRDLANQLLGQAQLADAFSKFSRTVSVSKLAYVKENKLYQALKGMKLPNGSEIDGTWEGYCNLLGMSVDKADADITNLRAFGEEALESMSRMGIGYREMRQFRRLPDDQKTALIEVAKTGDKDSFLELAEDLIAKHAKEKEALTKRAEEAEADLEARARVLEDKDAKINQLSADMAKLKKRVKSLPPADVGEEIRQEVTMMAGQAEVGIRAMRAGLQALVDHSVEHNIPHDDFMSGVICQLEQALRELRSEFDVKAVPDGDATPAWMRPGAVEAANANIAQAMAAAGWKRDANGSMVPADTPAGEA